MKKDRIEAITEALDQGRTYFYRAYANNDEGTAYGPEHKFTVENEQSTFTGMWAKAEKVSDDWYNLDGFGLFFQDKFPLDLPYLILGGYLLWRWITASGDGLHPLAGGGLD